MLIIIHTKSVRVWVILSKKKCHRFIKLNLVNCLGIQTDSVSTSKNLSLITVKTYCTFSY